MRGPLSIAATASLLLTACGGGPPGPVALAYRLPEPSTLVYTNGDTVSIDIDAGGQSFQITQNSSSTYSTAFTRSGDGVQVSLTVDELSGRMTQPMGAAVRADAGDVSGPLVFTLDRRGDVVIVSQPEIADDAATFFSPLGTAHTFFPGLPGRPVTMGDAWTDTIRYSGPQGNGEASSVSVLSYTVTADTVIAGRSVVRIELLGTSEQTVTGAIQGMSFTQNLSGDLEGFVLWDLTRGVMVENFTDADFRGSMDVSAAPFPLSLRLRGQSRAVLGG